MLFFSAHAAMKQSRVGVDGGDYVYHQLLRAHQPLHSTRRYISSTRGKVVDAAGGEGEPGDRVCEIADPPVKFLI